MVTPDSEYKINQELSTSKYELHMLHSSNYYFIGLTNRYWCTISAETIDSLA